jgi:hypothetical protein
MAANRHEDESSQDKAPDGRVLSRVPQPRYGVGEQAGPGFRCGSFERRERAEAGQQQRGDAERRGVHAERGGYPGDPGQDAADRRAGDDLQVHREAEKRVGLAAALGRH